MRIKVKAQNARVLLPLLLFAIYGLWCLTINMHNIPRGYYVTFLLPLAYVFVFCSLLWKPFTINRSPFISTYCIVQAFRFIVLSLVTIVSYSSGHGNLLFGRNIYSDGLLTEAGVLMIIELITTAAVINYYSRVNRNLPEKKELVLSFSSTIYIAFFIIALFLVVALPQIRTGLTFLIGYDSEGDIDTLSTGTLLVREFFVTSKYFLLFAAIKTVVTKTDFRSESNKKMFLPLLIILLICMIVVGLRVGTNRKRIVADAVACIVIVVTLFPNHKRPVFTFFGLLTIILVVSTSIFRGATQSFETFGADLFAPASLQSYLCGQYNICCALETANLFGKDINIGTLLYTSFRSFFGIGSLISNIDIHTLSYYYNQVSSMGYTYLRESQIIPLIGEGTIYFTPYLSALWSMIFVYLGICVDRIYQLTRHLEYRFISIVLAVYFGQALCLSSNIIINNVTFKLALFVPIVFIANSIKSRN